MNRKKFFDTVRQKPFGRALTQQQVDGINAILDSCVRNAVTDPHHVANILAQVCHETGTYMLPIKETVYASHKDKNPSDATVIARLNSAFAKGQLSWVKTPYWRDGWFGRGPIQITHRANYQKMGKRLGVDLVGNRDLALNPSVGADIAVVGMSEGMFTGKKLADYRFPAALDAKPASNPRRIVNGPDGTDAKIAGYHRAFLAAIQAAGGPPKSLNEPVRPEPAEHAPDRPLDPVPMPPPPDDPGVDIDDEPRHAGALRVLVISVAILIAIGFIAAGLIL